MMAGLSDVVSDERTARMVLSMLIEPNDPVTGRILSRLGAVETLWLAERDGAVVGLSPMDAQVWRDHLGTPSANELTARSNTRLLHVVERSSQAIETGPPPSTILAKSPPTCCGLAEPHPSSRAR